MTTTNVPKRRHIDDILRYVAAWCQTEQGDARYPLQEEVRVFETRSSFEKHIADMEAQDKCLPRFLVIDLHARDMLLAEHVCGSKTPIEVLFGDSK